VSFLFAIIALLSHCFINVSGSYKHNALALGVGIGVGSLFLCTCLCLCIVMGVVIGGVAYRKHNRTRTLRTTTVQYRPDSAGVGVTYRVTGMPENKNFATNVQLPLATTANVHLPQPNAAANAHLPQVNSVGVSGAVAPQNVGTGFQTTSRGTETSTEARNHDSSGPGYNEDSSASHSDDDEQPLLP